MSESLKGYVKAAAINKNGYFDFCVVEDGNDYWIQSKGKQTLCKKGDNVTLSYTEGQYGLEMVKGSLKIVEAPRQQSKPANYDKSKTGWVDNTVGMAIGAAANNAVSLVANKIIAEKDVPAAMVTLFKLTEYAKKLAAAGDIEKLLEVTDFSFVKSAVKKAVAEKQEEQTEEAAEAPKSTRGRKPKAPPPPPEPEPEPEVEEVDTDDYSDDSPF